MKDPLKHFMAENREAFNDSEPPTAIWDKIEGNLAPKPAKYRRLRRFMSAAAAVLLLFGFGTLTGIFIMKESVDVVEISPEDQKNQNEYQEAEAYYTAQVNAKLTSLKAVQKDSATQADIAELEASFGNWKEELGPNTTDEEVLGVMIQQYQLKIEILEKTIQRIQESKPFNNGSKTAKL